MSQLSRGNLAPTDLGGKYLSLLRVYTGELRLVKPDIYAFLTTHFYGLKYEKHETSSFDPTVYKVSVCNGDN